MAHSPEGTINVRFIPLNGPPIVRTVMFAGNEGPEGLLKQMGITRPISTSSPNGTWVVGIDGPKLDRSPQPAKHYSDQTRLVMRKLENNIRPDFSKDDPPVFEIEEVLA